MLVAHILVTHGLGPARSQQSLAKLSNISFSIAYTLDAYPGWVHHWKDLLQLPAGSGRTSLTAFPLNFGNAGAGLRWNSP